MMDAKHLEELKRLRCADPGLWLEVFQKTIDWLDSQQPIARASKEGCLRAQQKHSHPAPTEHPGREPS